MSDVDLTLVPWNRLAKLAPPGTTLDDLQAAANRWSLTTDLYAAAADLWEEAAFLINLAPDATPTDTSERVVSKVSQDGITVEYAGDAQIGDSQSTRHSQHAQMMANVRRLRAKAKPKSVLVHDPDYDPWLNRPYPDCDPERIIPVIE